MNCNSGTVGIGAEAKLFDGFLRNYYYICLLHKQYCHRCTSE